MIPILYNHAETSFTTNGLGRLADAISCKVTEELNGIYELVLVYPITGRHYSDLIAGRIIYASHDDTKDPQPFDIYRKTAPINGQVTFYARHISYRLNNIVVKPFEASSCVSLFAEINPKSINDNPFTFSCTVSSAKNIELNRPMSVRALLCGTDSLAVPQNFEGEYRWDKFTVHFDLRRGSDTSITLRRGKNITDITHDINAGQVFTAVVPYWLSSDGAELVMLPELYIGITGEGTEKIGLLDLSHQFNVPPELEDLRTEAQKTLATSNNPEESITVKFFELWQSEEYASYSVLQRAFLGDTVKIVYTDMGLNASLRVVKTVYDTLMDRYDSMELGKPKESYGTVLQKQFQDAVMQLVPSKSAIQEAIDHATELITGGLGGHVIISTDADGNPNEILIMDTADIQTAVHVLRINMAGIGFSDSGYEGPFDTAWTLDGRFYANFITAGTLTADLIKAGTLADGNGITNIDMTTGQGYIGLLNLRTVEIYDDSQAEYVDIARFYSDGHPYLLATGSLPAEGTNTNAGFVFRSTGEFNLGDDSQYLQFRREWNSATNSYKWKLDLSITNFVVGALTATSATIGGSSVATQQDLENLNTDNLQYIHFNTDDSLGWVGVRVSSTANANGYDALNPYSFLVNASFAAMMWQDKPRVKIGDGLLTLYDATAQAKKRMELAAGQLNFYKPDGTTIAAYYGANGMMVNEAIIGGFNVDTSSFYTNYVNQDTYHAFAIKIQKPTSATTNVIEMQDKYSPGGQHTPGTQGADTELYYAGWVDASGDARFRAIKLGATPDVPSAIGGGYSDSNLAARDYIEIRKTQFGSGQFSYRGSMRIGNIYADQNTTKFYDLTATAGPTLTFLDIKYDVINDKYSYEVHTSEQSSKRYKNHVRNLGIDEARKLLHVTSVVFQYKPGYLRDGDEDENTDIPGFYAEDVEQYVPRGVYHNCEGQTENWRPERIIPLMLKIIQDHEDRNAKLEAKIASLEERLAKLEAILS